MTAGPSERSTGSGEASLRRTKTREQIVVVEDGVSPIVTSCTSTSPRLRVVSPRQARGARDL